MLALTRFTRPARRDAGIDVLARDAVATKELTAIFVPFGTGTLLRSEPVPVFQSLPGDFMEKGGWGHAQEPGNLCDSRAIPRWPSERSCSKVPR